MVATGPARTTGRRITDKLEELDKDAPFYSFEFFPPKTDMGLENLHARIARMTKLEPLFVTVTWGTGGSTADKSLELAKACERQHGLTTCLHLTCTNMDSHILDRALEEAKANGIRNILALRGDPPRGQEYWTPNEGDFVYAVDLVRYIRKQYGDWFCIGVAAYPEGHADNTHPEHMDPASELPFLAAKVQAGADFILTQLFYDVDAFLKFQKLLSEYEGGMLARVPLIPAIMPIQSYQTLMRMTALSHAAIPPAIHDAVEQVKGDDEAVKSVGVQVAIDMIHSLRHKTGGAVRGAHFCTLNLEKSVALILKHGGLFRKASRETSPVGVRVPLRPSIVQNGTDGRHRPAADKIVDQMARIDMLTNPTNVNGQDTHDVDAQSLEEEAVSTSEGHGTQAREATWDEFPNGRFGDSRSPAYGEIDGWGVSLGVHRTKALQLWGEPKTADDITRVFTRHLNGEIDATPWSNGPVSAETAYIKDHLVALNTRGLWTVGSQPAVHCAPSSHPAFGWGPAGGHIFQKSFVECFMTESAWRRLRDSIKGDPMVSYYAGTRMGRFETSMKDSGDCNAVTWGIFPGKEIVQPTIIEEVSFKAWKDEAFALWAEWERLFEPASQSARLLRGVMERVWLVSLVHHDFKDEEALWRLMLEASLPQE
ncbi:methylenetetrahydrofolate reductase-domain-containing protein [Protomyces lactucae-debilis]|uniref:Methylenetetrahydrofolate reductase-domain-containing protein n=1 Tax=Protomyces lactucae-debilis TaxID=2754530 RepID=A0A1Y2F509_PROLT|nr:methylenetetrahydrofolate reductase-domain-containing protein [Protomyces lactucae-debilis]ORY79008.1 methylenetetrahydrofolate reductase-domain-containing protein [Protomyces lactucae-debilis]